MYDFNSMKNVDLQMVNINELVDISEISVEQNISKDERIAAFIKQIKNPYCFKCGKFVVKAKFSDKGLTLEDCLQSILI